MPFFIEEEHSSLLPALFPYLAFNPYLALNHLFLPPQRRERRVRASPFLHFFMISASCQGQEADRKKRKKGEALTLLSLLCGGKKGD